MPSTLIQDLQKVKVYLNHYRASNNPEEFGCACEPEKVCGTCKERDRQEALTLAVNVLTDLINKEVQSEEEAFQEVLRVGVPELPEVSAKRWWFNKGYQVAPKVYHII